MNARIVLVVLAASLAGCAGPALKPSVTPGPPGGDALLVLPGFGYGRDEGNAFRAVTAQASAAGIDLFVPDYLTRSGLASSRGKLARFIRDQRLHRYRRVHVFAFIAGGWTINPLADAGAIPNLATVTYDRSPYQERAPRIAAAKLPVFAWLRYGSTIFDVAATPYVPLQAAHVKVGLIVESKPTAFVTKHEAAARAYGPFTFGCESFLQRHDDCVYVAMDHDDLYMRFAEVWPELRAFIQTGRFTEAANRTAPVDDGRFRGARE
jgi:hypothetical protein